MHARERPGTFSIVAADPGRGFWGVAVSTYPISVGAVVPWVQWRVGAIATQSWTNYTYGPNGLSLLRKGLRAEEVVRRLTRADPKREIRQLGVVDRKGQAAAWTGKKCKPSASHVVGDGFSCQGNMLANDAVVPSMVRAFETARGSLASRMFRALDAGYRSGGDRRGVRSAALLVDHSERWLPKEAGTSWVNIRVDLHPHPVRELGRIMKVDEALTRRFLRAREARLRRLRANRRASRTGS